MIIVFVDTPSNRRRYRINKLIMGYEVRVQKSVFECQISWAETKELIGLLEKIIDPTEDAIRLQACCIEDWNQIQVLGGPSPTPKEDHWVVY